MEDYGLGVLLLQAPSSVLDLPVHWQRALNVLSYALSAPTLLMIDEPTYGLDDSAAAWLLDWLRSLAERHRLLVTLHHQGQARQLADRIILIGGGRVLAHCPTPVFFSQPPNTWVERFIRTGSLPIASPGALPEELSDDAEQPPPLPAAALAALSEFRLSETEIVPLEDDASLLAKVAVDPPSPLPTKPLTASTQSEDHPRLRTGKKPVSVQLGPASSTLRAVLPPVSNWGVEAAAKVGRNTIRGQAGPSGFEWILPGRLAGCAEPGLVAPIDYDLELLAHASVTHLITLTEKDLPQDALRRHGLRNLHLPIYDREAPSIAQTYMLVYRMQRLLEEGEVLAVHCKAGIGRTGSILAAWLIREGGLSAEEAIRRLRAIKRSYVQTEAQESFLHAFEIDILKRQ